MTDTIHRRIPPQRLVMLANPFVRAVARSPLHGLVDDALLVLHIVGRRTGHRYDVPVGFVPLGSDLIVVTQHAWRVNLRGASEVEVTHRGRRVRRHVELDEDPGTVAVTLHRVVQRYGTVRAQRRLGLTFPAGREPTRTELEAAAREFGLTVVRLAATP
jgi:hypothetical protein